MLPTGILVCTCSTNTQHDHVITSGSGVDVRLMASNRIQFV